MANLCYPSKMGYNTSILDKALDKRAKQDEIMRKKMLDLTIRLLTEMSDSFTFQEAIIFGSVVEPGRFRQSSDIDIGIMNIPANEYFEIAALLSSKLGRDVDLVDLAKCHFADKIYREGYRWIKQD